MQQNTAPNLPSQPQANAPLVDRAAAELRRGGVVVITSGETRIAVLAAELADPDTFARLERAGSDTRLVITGRRAAVLGHAPAGDPAQTCVVQADGGFTLPLISRLMDPLSTEDAAADIRLTVRPADHVPEQRAAIALVKAARLLPAALIHYLSGAEDEADAPIVSVADIDGYADTHALTLKRISGADVPLENAEHTRVEAFRPADGGVEHLALIVGEIDTSAPVLVRLHSECFTGDLLGSLRCDCGEQLKGAIKACADAGGGVVLYLAQEGRGIGLVNKLRAYQLQDAGADTVEANELLGFDDDERLYLPAAEMLRQLGIAKVRLLTNNPTKTSALTRHGIEVTERVPLIIDANRHNRRYLATKAARSGHMLDG